MACSFLPLGHDLALLDVHRLTPLIAHPFEAGETVWSTVKVSPSVCGVPIINAEAGWAYSRTVSLSLPRETRYECERLERHAANGAIAFKFLGHVVAEPTVGERRKTPWF